MTPMTIGLVCIAGLVVLLFSGMPLGFVMGLIGFVGFAFISDLESALHLLATVPYSTFADYGFSALPLFMLMGIMCSVAGISADLYRAAYYLLGRVSGGLAMATVAACAAFGAICGSTTATAVTMGVVALPEMKKYNYDAGLATGCIAAGGTLAFMIPPSLGFIIYGIVTGESIGKLFIAGIIPGILQALLLIGTIYILCKRNPQLGPRGPVRTRKEKAKSLVGVWPMLVLFGVIMGGLYLGWFSPTEGGGIGAFGAFLFALVTRRLTWSKFTEAIYQTAKVSSMCFIIVVGAMIFSYLLAVSRVPTELSAAVVDAGLNKYIVMGMIMLLYLFLGCIMDTISMILLTAPIFYPLVITLGFDPIWFGVVVILMAEIGLITPPVGINVFVISGVARDVPLYTIFRGVWPFIITGIVLAIILVAFPEIAMFLPNMM